MSQFRRIEDAIFIGPQPSEQDLQEAQEGPFLLYRATGARAALLLSLSKAKQHGWTAEQAFAEAKRMGFDLKTSAEFSTFVARTIG